MKLCLPVTVFDYQYYYQADKTITPALLYSVPQPNRC